MFARPMIQIQTLASGSSGNMAIIRGHRTTIILDLGLASQRGTREALCKAGIGPGDLTAFLVSHAHSDHLSYAGLRVALEYEVPILTGHYARLRALELYRYKTGRGLPIDTIQVIHPGTTYAVGDMEVTPFVVPHDVPTFGFLFTSYSNKRRLVVATDLGCLPDDLLKYFANADAVLIESNYNENLLAKSTRHPEDKARIMSDEGHLSNTQAGRVLKKACEASEKLPKVVMLVHLSKDHNEPGLAKVEVANESGLDRDNLLVAPRTVAGPLIEI